MQFLVHEGLFKNTFEVQPWTDYHLIFKKTLVLDVYMINFIYMEQTLNMIQNTKGFGVKGKCLSFPCF